MSSRTTGSRIAPLSCKPDTTNHLGGRFITLAEDQNSELVIRCQDGRIREKDSHGTTRETSPASGTAR
jgi:hypothetical protein